MMRATGQRIGQGYGPKIKGMSLTTATGGAGAFNWDNLGPQIDAAISIGANLVKLYVEYPAGAQLGNGAWLSGVASETRYLNYCANKGLMVAIGHGWPSSNPTIAQCTNAQIVAGITDMATRYEQYPNIATWDAYNEINSSGLFTPTSGANWVTKVKSIVQAVSTIPVSASLSVNNKSDLSGAWVQAFYPVCDYLDIHYYLGNGSPLSGEILTSDITALRAHSWWTGKPVLIGEGGANLASEPLRRGPQFNSMGRSAELAEFAGAIGFSCQDFQTVTTGIFDTGTLAERHDCTDNFRTWTGRP